MRPVLPSACPYSVGIPKRHNFVAEYPARMYPCQRFDAVLTNRSA